MKERAIQHPCALRPGDRVRLVAPASPFDPKAFAAGVAALSELGYEPVFGREEFARRGFLAGPDEARAVRLERALLEPDTRAVWCIRGGYGSTRLLPHLDLPRLRRHPKILVGFSDVTALLVNLAVPGGMVCIHGPVVTQLPQLGPAHRAWLNRVLRAVHPAGRAPLGRLRTLVVGRAEGRLVAGNLALLASLAGTPYLPSLAGAILCLEDVGEEAYRLDRMFQQLLQAGALRGLRGVVLGELVDCRPSGSGPGSARAALERLVATLGVPALSGAAFGHGRRQAALPLGVRARLEPGALSLLEAAVA